MLKADHDALVNAGSACMSCGAVIVQRRQEPTNCADCDFLQRSQGEESHTSLIRCPACGHTQWPAEMYGEGEHSALCRKCEHEYTVQASITIHYTSPARLKAEAV